MAFSKSGGKPVSSSSPHSIAPPKRIDLVFAMDCTSSMDSYIEHAQQNIFKIAEGINSQQKVDLRFALVEYRDHEQTEHTAGESGFVTRVLDFTEHLKEMKKRLDECTAVGGGDVPEAIADALKAVLDLSWRKTSVKICVLIADAPPHGLGCDEDAFDAGCPCKLDPMEIAHKMAEQAIMVYTVGCEPSVTGYKDWFMAISHITSGQYLPLASPTPLFRAIIAAVYEGLSMSDIAVHVGAILMKSNRAMTEEALVDTVMEELKESKTKLLQSEKGALQKPSKQAVELAKLKSMAEVRSIFKPSSDDDSETSSTVDDFVLVDSTLTREQATRIVKQVFSSSKSPLLTSPNAVFEKRK